MKIYKYLDFINEYNGGGSLPVMHFKGVNFGDGGKKDVGVANFGDKGDKSFNKRGVMNPIEDNLIYSEYTNKYYSSTDIRDLLFKYDIWCKQNNEPIIPINSINSKTLDYILKILND